jgi:hypothetical protein
MSETDPNTSKLFDVVIAVGPNDKDIVSYFSGMALPKRVVKMVAINKR